MFSTEALMRTACLNISMLASDAQEMSLTIGL
jgi:hypothetical protein